MDMSHLRTKKLAKKHPKVTYGTRIVVDAYIHWTEDQLVYALSYKLNILLETLISLLFSHL